MQRGLIRDGELVCPHCEAAPLLESGDGPLDGISLLVCLSVETRWAASDAASPQAVADLVRGLRDDVRGLRDDGSDAATTEVPADRARGVGPICKDDRRAGSWPAESASRDPDSGHDPLEGWRVTGLACSDVDSQRPCPAVAGQVDLRAQAAAGAPQRVVLGLGPAPRYLLHGLARRLPAFGPGMT